MGQNKNGHVLWLALWLVELQYFQSVEFVYSVRSLSLILNEIGNITHTHILSYVLSEYLQLLDKFYQNFEPGTVKKHHLFLVEAEIPTTMISKSHNNNEFGNPSTFNHKIVMTDRIIKKKEAFNNKMLLGFPGVKPIKQVEFWKKWGQFIPPHGH